MYFFFLIFEYYYEEIINILLKFSYTILIFFSNVTLIIGFACHEDHYNIKHLVKKKL